MTIAIQIVYGFNMTDQLQQETKILPLCYSQKEIFIEAINQTCASIYGGPVD